MADPRELFLDFDPVDLKKPVLDIDIVSVASGRQAWEFTNAAMLKVESKFPTIVKPNEVVVPITLSLSAFVEECSRIESVGAIALMTAWAVDVNEPLLYRITCIEKSWNGRETQKALYMQDYNNWQESVHAPLVKGIFTPLFYEGGLDNVLLQSLLIAERSEWRRNPLVASAEIVAATRFTKPETTAPGRRG